jgi:dihydrofolate reductase
VVGGANVIQQVLRAGLADQLHVDITPVLLSAGLRLLEPIAPDRVRLEKIGAEEVGLRTHLEFRVVK